jgi:hypothetical protein
MGAVNDGHAEHKLHTAMPLLSNTHRVAFMAARYAMRALEASRPSLGTVRLSSCRDGSRLMMPRRCASSFMMFLGVGIPSFFLM